MAMHDSVLERWDAGGCWTLWKVPCLGIPVSFAPSTFGCESRRSLVNRRSISVHCDRILDLPLFSRIHHPKQSFLSFSSLFVPGREPCPSFRPHLPYLCFVVILAPSQPPLLYCCSHALTSAIQRPLYLQLRARSLEGDNARTRNVSDTRPTRPSCQTHPYIASVQGFPSWEGEENGDRLPSDITLGNHCSCRSSP